MDERKRGLHTVKKLLTVSLVMSCLLSPASIYAAEAGSTAPAESVGPADNTAAAFALELSANEVRRGGAITISGTVPGGSHDVVLKIISPNQTVFYVDVISAAGGSYGVDVAIPTSEELAPFGTYTVVTGSGGVQASKTFSVAGDGNNPGNGGENPGNGGNDPDNGGGNPGNGGSDPDKGGGSGGGSGGGGGGGTVIIPPKQPGISDGAGQVTGAVIQPEKGQNGSYIVGSGTLAAAAGQAKDAVTIQLPAAAGESGAPLEFPAGSLKDLQSKQLDLIITSGNHTVRFPAGSIGTSAAKEQSILRFVLNTAMTEEAGKVIEQTLQTNTDYTQTGIVLSVVIQLVTDGQVVEIHELDKPASVTIQLTAEQAAKLRAPLAGVYYVDGKQLEYIGGKLNGDVFTFAAKHFSYYTVLEYNKTFVDLAGHWAEQAVNQLAAKGIVTGVDERHYEPNRAITRAEFVTLIMRAIEQTGKSSANGANPFADVKAGQYYTGPIAAAAELGIVTGYDGKFRPADRITREEAVVSLVRAAKYFSLAGKQQGEPSFADAGKISSWAAAAVKEAWSAGLIEGDGKAFKPKNSVTRAEVAVMIQRLLADSL
ncbi:S-layer homology domain-containing protein [Paenibacillus medicaginis]|uniref:S-layer homology domain-containing protein n=1 Tax=Paenibacillus medicaginis TaxID=1470560 RepID=A0ABV5C5E2_9BACL